MFQTFDSAGDPAVGRPRVEKLRQRLAAEGLDGFIVPRADEHQGEYVPPRAARLRWLTGFSGSAGAAVVLKDRAVMFVDGRYQLQVRQETDQTVFTVESLIDNPPSSWLKDNIGKGVRIGFDPWLHTIAEVKALRASADKVGAELVPIAENPVDAIWDDQPALPLEPVEIHPIAFAGELARDKLARLAAAIEKDGATHAILTDPSSIAWAFNIRGNDVPHTPLALGFAILAADGKHRLFMAGKKFSRTVAAYLTQLADLHGLELARAEREATEKQAAKARQTSRPIPPVPPVTTTFLPSRPEPRSNGIFSSSTPFGRGDDRVLGDEAGLRLAHEFLAVLDELAGIGLRGKSPCRILHAVEPDLADAVPGRLFRVPALHLAEPQAAHARHLPHDGGVRAGPVGEEFLPAHACLAADEAHALDHASLLRGWKISSVMPSWMRR